jgi:hypothetical protein
MLIQPPCQALILQQAALTSAEAAPKMAETVTRAIRHHHGAFWLHGWRPLGKLRGATSGGGNQW